MELTLEIETKEKARLDSVMDLIKDYIIEDD